MTFPHEEEKESSYDNQRCGASQLQPLQAPGPGVCVGPALSWKGAGPQAEGAGPGKSTVCADQIMVPHSSPQNCQEHVVLWVVNSSPLGSDSGSSQELWASLNCLAPRQLLLPARQRA